MFPIMPTPAGAPRCTACGELIADRHDLVMINGRPYCEVCGDDLSTRATCAVCGEGVSDVDAHIADEDLGADDVDLDTDPLPICARCEDPIAAGDELVSDGLTSWHGACADLGDTVGGLADDAPWTPAELAQHLASYAEYAVATALGRLTGSVADMAAAVKAGDYARAVQILNRGVDEVWDDAVVIEAQQAVVIATEDPEIDTDIPPWLMVQISAVITAWHLAVDDAVAGDCGAVARAIGYMEVIVR